MTAETTKIIEINGVKFEVDARTASIRQLTTLKVGARVKVLKEEKVHHGVIIGFEPFKENPVVIVAYLGLDYWGNNANDIKFLYYSEKSKEQIVVSQDDDGYAVDRDEVVRRMQSDINKKRVEIKEIEDKIDYFLKNFQSYWNAFEMPKAETKEEENA